MYDQVNILLTTDEDSTLTDDDIDALIEFCSDELDASGRFRADKFRTETLNHDSDGQPHLY